jgi:hypothetical protein
MWRRRKCISLMVVVTAFMRRRHSTLDVVPSTRAWLLSARYSP